MQHESQRRYEYQTDTEEFQHVERLFVFLQILSACFVAFAHGANDVANAIGPLSAVLSVAMAGGDVIAAKAPVPPWVLALGGAGIVVGLATWGWRVMETIGRKITHLTPTRGVLRRIRRSYDHRVGIQVRDPRLNNAHAGRCGDRGRLSPWHRCAESGDGARCRGLLGGHAPGWRAPYDCFLLRPQGCLLTVIFAGKSAVTKIVWLSYQNALPAALGTQRAGVHIDFLIEGSSMRLFWLVRNLVAPIYLPINSGARNE